MGMENCIGYEGFFRVKDVFGLDCDGGYIIVYNYLNLLKCVFKWVNFFICK